mgnify:CR=1 FL=1
MEVVAFPQLASRLSLLLLLPKSKGESCRPCEAVHPCQVNVENITRSDDIAVPRSFASLADQNTVYFARHLRWSLEEFTVLVFLNCEAVLHTLGLGPVAAHACFAGIRLVLLDNEQPFLHH